MDGIIEKATKIVMKQIQQELNRIVEEGTSPTETSLQELKNSKNIFGELVFDIVTNKIDAFAYKGLEHFNFDNIIITQRNKIKIRDQIISGDVILNISGRDEDTNKKLRKLFYGGEDKDIIYHPNMTINENVTAEDLYIMKTIQERLTKRINERIEKMKIEVK